MSLQTLLSSAASEMAEVVGRVKPDDLTAATPCREYDVRALVNHLLYWAPVIEGVGLRKAAVFDRADEGGTDHTGGDWQAEYLGWLDRIAAAWSPGPAWEGVAEVGGRRVPARVIGEKTLCELVLHGWDLARASGQGFHCRDDVADETRRILLATADETRRMGMFGPPVTVPDSAPALDRALACSGRDPRWPG
ncbi:TIGR03086 family metal-binding protein [Streptomyces achromogenes]|uniref:TIGR03086 family metal-binding protein n=1 Tax=Streptomyces achromogenes TaxID=67255 RepID=UPI0037007CC1